MATQKRTPLTNKALLHSSLPASHIPSLFAACCLQALFRYSTDYTVFKIFTKNINNLSFASVSVQVAFSPCAFVKWNYFFSLLGSSIKLTLSDLVFIQKKYQGVFCVLPASLTLHVCKREDQLKQCSSNNEEKWFGAKRQEFHTTAAVIVFSLLQESTKYYVHGGE